MIFSIKPQIFELKCVFSYFRLKTYITLLLPVYVHSWEQRKLGEVGKCQSGIGFPDVEQGGKTGTPFYKVSDMNNYGNEQEMTCANNYVTDEQIVRKNWKPITEVPAVIFAKVGAAIMLNRKRLCRFPFLLDNNTMAYKFGGKWDTNFGKTLFEKIDLTELVQVGALPSYNATDVENLDIKMPIDINEQKVIGEFFAKLDNLITLHQCKCQIDGCRFQSPLAITWEQRKVTEIGKIYIGLVTTMTKHYTDEGTLLIRNSDIKDGKFEFGDNPIYLEKTFAEKNETRMHQIGDVITVHTGDVGTSAVITENEAKSIGFATIVTRPNPKIIDSNYLCSFLNTDKHKKWAVSISTGDGRTNYNLGDYFELVVPVPSIAEQKKIASYIQKLNRLITLHQCE